eukprot:gene9687-biopygen2077
MSCSDELITHAINYIREKLKKRPDKFAITSFVNSRHGLNHTDVADTVDQLEAKGVIFRKVKKKRHSFFISDLDEDENSSIMENETEDSNVERKEEEKQRESVFAPRHDSPPSTIMDFIRAELEQRELRLANKIMANLEGKYLEKANNEKVLIERLEREVDFLKSEIQNKNNLLSSLLTNMENGRTNNRNEDKGSECKNNAGPYTDKGNEWRQIIPKRAGIRRTSKEKRPSSECDWHASYEDFPPLSNKFDLLSSLELNDTALDHFCTVKSPVKSQESNKVTARNKRVIRKDLERMPSRQKDLHRVIDQDQQPKRTQDCITIIGDSMVKNIQGFKMKQAIKNDRNVYVKSFSGATVDCMNSYVCPTIKKNPKTIILHCGTNDLRRSQPACNIARDIFELARTLETRSNSVLISGLVPRGDSLNGKATEDTD